VKRRSTVPFVVFQRQSVGIPRTSKGADRYGCLGPGFTFQDSRGICTSSNVALAGNDSKASSKTGSAFLQSGHHRWPPGASFVAVKSKYTGEAEPLSEASLPPSCDSVRINLYTILRANSLVDFSNIRRCLGSVANALRQKAQVPRERKCRVRFKEVCTQSSVSQQ
jgi:hypothetical protein